MGRWLSGFAIGLALAACNRDADPTADSDIDIDDTDVEDPGYPSTFTSGKFRLTAFVLQPVDTGPNVDEDPEGDNNLPKLLTFAASAVDPALAPDEINLTIAENLATDVLITLLEANYADLALTVAVLGGAKDPETLVIGVDPLSLDSQGEPISVLDGVFTTELDFSVSSDRIDVPAVFRPGDAPVLVPIALSTLQGTMSAGGSAGTLSGVAPAQPFIDQVIDPLIPDEGWDSDGDGDIDQSKESLMKSVTDIVNNPNMSDWVFEDGSRGITAVFSYEAVPADF